MELRTKMKNRSYLEYKIGGLRHHLCYQEIAMFSKLSKQLHITLNSGKEVFIRDEDGRLYETVWQRVVSSI